jgi:hypothetical protein
MAMSDGAAALLFVIVVLAATCWGYMIGASIAASDEREAAVKAGVARYEVDAKTGVKRFVYGLGVTR